MSPHNVSEALALLRRLGANHWLLRHHELVAETAAELLDALVKNGVLRVDRDLVLIGAALHDAGKITVPAEMSEPGHEHEPAGMRMLHEERVSDELAYVCISHAAWDIPDLPLEHLLIALADKLWKGKRVDDLEMLVVSRIALDTQRPTGEVFADLDPIFEAIADRGDERLSRSST